MRVAQVPAAGGLFHRQIHGILSGACKRAVRCRWIGTNPIEQAEPPPAGRTDPRPPTPHQAARIANEAWTDVDWGMLVWLALMTGASTSLVARSHRASSPSAATWTAAWARIVNCET